MNETGLKNLPAQEPTVAATVAALQRASFARSYGVRGPHLRDEQTHELFAPSDFTVEALYRFEGESDPADEAIVVALSDLMSTARGVLVAAYGPAASADEDAVLCALLDWRART